MKPSVNVRTMVIHHQIGLVFCKLIGWLYVYDVFYCRQQKLVLELHVYQIHKNVIVNARIDKINLLHNRLVSIYLKRLDLFVMAPGKAFTVNGLASLFRDLTNFIFQHNNLRAPI